jgi:hypothetical protein
MNYRYRRSMQRLLVAMLLSLTASSLSAQSKIAPAGGPASITARPDSGYAGGTIDFTIVGQNTNFQASTNASELRPDAVELIRGTDTVGLTNPTSIIGQNAAVSLNIPPMTPAGLGAIRFFRTNTPTFDLQAPFTILPLATITPALIADASAMQGDTVTVHWKTPGGHFSAMQGTATVYTRSITLWWDRDGYQYSIVSSALDVSSDTTATATFEIPANAKIDLWDASYTMPDISERIYTKNVFQIVSGARVYSVHPDSARRGTTDTLMLVTRALDAPYNIKDVFLSKGSKTISGTWLNRIDLTPVFTIPVTADLGLWDINVDLKSSATPIILPQSFRVLGVPSGVGAIANEPALVLKASPNPSFGVAHLSFNLGHEGETQITVEDILGRVVMSFKTEHLAAGVHDLEWNTASVQAGTYFFKVQSGATVRSVKLTVVH